MFNYSFEKYDRDLFVPLMAVGEESCMEIISRARNIEIEPQTGKAIVFIGGIGSGKTWLLSHISNELGIMGIGHKNLDFAKYSTHSKSVEDCIIEIIQDLQEPGFNLPRGISSQDASRMFVKDPIDNYLKGNKEWFLLIDNVFDMDWKLLKEVEELILGPLAATHGVFVVMTGYSRKYPWSWFELMQSELRLIRAFNKDECKLQLEKLGKDHTDNIIVDEFFSRSGGYPALIAFLAKYGENGYERFLKKIFANRFVEVNDQAIVSQYLGVLSVLDSFNDAHIQAIFNHIPTTEKIQFFDKSTGRGSNAQKIREQLVALKLIWWEDKAQGFVMDGSVRRSIQGSIKPDLWKEYENIAIKVYEDWWDKYMVEGAVKMRIRRYASKRIDLVGKKQKDDLDKIVSAVKQRKTSIFYVYGEGGIGKTKLIEEILDHISKSVATQNEKIFSHRQVIDLFHTANQQVDGLQGAICDAIWAQMESQHPYVFSKFKTERQNAQEQHVNFGASYPSEAMPTEWSKDYQQLVEEGFVVLALDTSERLFRIDPLSDELSQVSDELSQVYNKLSGIISGDINTQTSLEWLFDKFLPEIHNTVVIISGRLHEEHEIVKRYLEKVSEGTKHPIAIERIGISGLTEDDAKEYWEGIKNANRDSLHVFNCLSRVSSDHIETFCQFYCEKSGTENQINPLALAILVDLVVFGSDDDNNVVENLFAQFPKWEVDNNRFSDSHQKVLAFLVAQLIPVLQTNSLELSDRIIDPLILLSYARKGVNADLMREFLGDSTDQRTIGSNRSRAHQTLISLLQRNLSIVKIHPRFPDDRQPMLYLHDAMYENSFVDTAWNDYTEKIVSFYESEMKKTRLKIRDLYSESFLQGHAFPLPQDVFELIVKWNQYAADLVYYSLSQHKRLNEFKKTEYTEDMRVGFDRYYKFAEEALFAGDSWFAQLLEMEMLGFLLDNQRSETEQNFLIKKTNFLNLVFADTIIRYLKRSRRFEVRDRSDVKEIQYDVAALKIKQNDLLSAHLANDELALSELKLFLTEEKIYKSQERKTSKEILKEIISTLESKTSDTSARKSVIIAGAYKTLGYLHRVEGGSRRALQDYQKSIELWRKYWELETEQANTLMNVAFALAEIGSLDAALDWGIDAKDLRLKRGTLPYIGLAFNVIGHIKLRSGLYGEALTEALTARRFFQSETDLYGIARNYLQRFQGLNELLLAECYRRVAGNMDIAPHQYENISKSIGNKQALLKEAITCSRRALEIFGYYNKNNVSYSEPERIVEALIEQGCAYRDWLLFTIGEKKYLIDEDYRIKQEAINSFRNAYEIARNHDLFSRAIDAKANLAWLFFYLSKCNIEDIEFTEIDVEEIKEAINTVEQILAEPDVQEYLIDMKQQPSIQKELVNNTVFGTLGKVFMLRGILEYDWFGRISYSDENIQLFISKHSGDEIKDILERIEDFHKFREQISPSNANNEQPLTKPEKGSPSILEKSIRAYSQNKGVAYMCLALEYDAYQSDFPTRDMKRAMRQLHDKLKKMSSNDFSRFLQNVEDFGKKFMKKNQMVVFLQDRLFIPKTEDKAPNGS